MKILLVIDCNTELINGVSQSVINLSKGLSNLGHDVRILMPAQDGKACIEEKAFLAPSGSFVLSYPGLRIARPLPKMLKKAIMSWKPDIIHTNTEASLYLASLRIARKTGAKHIHSFHTNFFDDYIQYSPFGKKLSLLLMTAYGKLCFRRLDGMISPSEWGRSVMERFHYTAPYYILPNGIRTDLFGADLSSRRVEIRRHYGIREEDTLLLFVGRVAVEKKISELLTYFDHIRDERVKLMIVGDGPMLGSLKERAETMKGKERIVFAGMIPPDQTCAYYGAGDIFVTASLSEIQPLTYVEAMASGLPVVCSYAPYIDGLVIDGETGYGIRDAAGFAKCVGLLTSEPQLRREMGEKAKQRVRERYSIETFARSCLRIYSEIMSGTECDKKDSH